MITYQETVIHWLLLEWKTSHTDHGHDLNVSKWKKGYYPSGELGYVYHKSFAGLFEHFSETKFYFLDGADGMKSMTKVNSNVAGHCRILKIVPE